MVSASCTTCWARLRRASATVVLLAFSALMVAPIAWVFVIVLAPPDRRFSNPPPWVLTEVDLTSFRRAFELLPIGDMVFNSLKVACLATLGATMTSVLAAYAFGRFEFRGRRLLFGAMVSSLVLPPQVTAVPLFLLMQRLGLLDRHEALFLPAMFSGLAIVLLKRAFEAVPGELEDAARTDGAGPLRILFAIMLPLVRPTVVAVAVVLFLATWNDYFWANLMLSSNDRFTLPQGLASLVGVAGEGEAAVVFAANVVAITPPLVLFLFFQRRFVESAVFAGLSER